LVHVLRGKYLSDASQRILAPVTVGDGVGEAPSVGRIPHGDTGGDPP
jgi:hypothetical protein